MNFYSGFLSQDYRNAQKAMEPEINREIEALKAKNQAEGRETTQRRWKWCTATESSGLICGVKICLASPHHVAL